MTMYSVPVTDELLAKAEALARDAVSGKNRGDVIEILVRYILEGVLSKAAAGSYTTNGDLADGREVKAIGCGASLCEIREGEAFEDATARYFASTAATGYVLAALEDGNAHRRTRLQLFELDFTELHSMLHASVQGVRLWKADNGKIRQKTKADKTLTWLRNNCRG